VKPGGIPTPGTNFQEHLTHTASPTQQAWEGEGGLSPAKLTAGSSRGPGPRSETQELREPTK
jgi:hypothetical protein